ncbi:MAG: ATP-binding cassette domain-containing protein [Alphaproteobacteria bacterium]|jgi:oligopeptide transport system ATP-binding protein|nr:peptide ABC transporter ATP-binding protein [Rhodospirillaceae bacterium]MDP6021411.1 ATP-binding cassette domain-containing protein [Alphaproteobacteria bacterium]MDP6257097.1 ATP-binding cassette domain-containing protein [Alphaproteobacteria bacterium]MDP7056620.1 ATP-binding cassette domain-containing protein [Alphaproteobacteria bacterium]MDP7230337.1 ATP-binding cassette domain-containing protein [Alphaproteobacteria bacterium]|tara:strand:- start:8818 stop:9810 length:993 start_codon:yes stop_codon:yes gene_type:complete
MLIPRTENLLEVRDLKVHFPVRGGIMGQRDLGSIKAVDSVSFTVRRGETLGMVGESGCGKSTTGLAILRMVDITGGSIILDGQDITNLSSAELRPMRRQMQMVFQDPYGALNPRLRVLDIVGEPLVAHGMAPSRPQLRLRVAELLELVGLAGNMIERYAHEFSGGQRQRIGIARALAVNPNLVVCDEPVSALDVSIQAQIINLMEDLQKELGLTYLFIAHDLAVVRHISDRIIVMYLGKIVEIASRDDLYSDPKHPYTQALLSAIPVASPDAEAERQLNLLEGEVPSALNPPSGCHFNPRCPMAHDDCTAREPDLEQQGNDHFVACHLHD